MVDSGAAAGSYIDCDFVERHNLPVEKTAIPIAIYNADGTINKEGSVRGFVRLRMQIGDHAEILELAITRIKSNPIFLGYEWLQEHNPLIDWAADTIKLDQCPPRCKYIQAIQEPDEDNSCDLELGDQLLIINVDDEKECQLCTITNDQGPNFISELRDVFSAQEFDALP